MKKISFFLKKIKNNTNRYITTFSPDGRLYQVGKNELFILFFEKGMKKEEYFLVFEWKKIIFFVKIFVFFSKQKTIFIYSFKKKRFSDNEFFVIMCKCVVSFQKTCRICFQSNQSCWRYVVGCSRQKCRRHHHAKESRRQIN